MSEFRPNLAQPIQAQREIVDKINAMVKEIGQFALKVESIGERLVINNATPGLLAEMLESEVKFAQAGSGSPSHSNVRTISPRSAVTLSRDGDVIMSEDLPEPVYMGYLNWLTGVLTITHKMVTVNGDAKWHVGSNNIYVPISDIAPNASIWSDKFTNNPNGHHANLGANEMKQGATYTNLCFANPGNELTLAQWINRATESPIQIVYQMIEPRTEQLTPHQLEMLHKQTIETSTGITFIRYLANLQDYIDTAIEAAIGG